MGEVRIRVKVKVKVKVELEAKVKGWYKDISAFLLTLEKTPSYAGGNKKLIVMHRATKIPTQIWYNI